jgi:pimeloyl-ACP methyl ester carboxylesterase
MTKTPDWRRSNGRPSRAARIVVPAVLAGVTAALTVYERHVLAGLGATMGADADGQFVFAADDVRAVVTPDGGMLHVEECGSGRPVILLHGHGANLRIFAVLAAQLRTAGLRVIAFDQRGFGRSSAVPPTFGFRGLIDDLAIVLSSLDLRDAIVVGHSMGGVVALGLAVQRPEVVADRVAALVVINGTARGPADRALQRVRAAALDWTVTEHVGRHPRHGLVLARGNFGLHAQRSHVAAVRTIGQASPAARRQGLTRRLLGIDLSDRLGEVNVPVVAVAGTLDRVIPASESERMVELLPRARLEVFSGAGHMVPLERPAEVVDVIVRLAAETRRAERSSAGGATDSSGA